MAAPLHDRRLLASEPAAVGAARALPGRDRARQDRSLGHLVRGLQAPHHHHWLRARAGAPAHRFRSRDHCHAAAHRARCSRSSANECARALLGSFGRHRSRADRRLRRDLRRRGGRLGRGRRGHGVHPGRGGAAGDRARRRPLLHAARVRLVPAYRVDAPHLPRGGPVGCVRARANTGHRAVGGPLRRRLVGLDRWGVLSHPVRVPRAMGQRSRARRFLRGRLRGRVPRGRKARESGKRSPSRCARSGPRSSSLAPIGSALR